MSGLRRPRKVLAAGWAILASLVAGTARGAESDATALAAWVAALDAGTLRDRDAVEERLRTRLSALPGNRSFGLWRAGGATVPGLAIADVDYRQPRVDGGATAGPLLALGVAPEPCVTRDRVAAAVPELRFSDMTPHDVPDAKAYWSRRGDGLAVSFGFSVRGPECLRSLVLSVDAP